MTLQEQKNRRRELLREARQITKNATSTDEERRHAHEILDECQLLGAEIEEGKSDEVIHRAAFGTGGFAATAIDHRADRRQLEKGWDGWLQNVRDAGTQGAAVDPQWQAEQRATGLSGGIGSDGGFAVPEIYAPMLEGPAIDPDFARGNGAQVFPCAPSAVFNLPRSKDTNRSGGCLSGTTQAFWRAEAAAATASQPELANLCLAPKSLAALCYATVEFLESASLAGGGAGAWVGRELGKALAFKQNQAWMSGLGAGQPAGIRNAACRLTEARVGANLIDATDVINMFSKVYHPADSVWLCSQSCIPQLAQLQIAVGTGGGVNWLFDWSGGLPPTLMGRPVIYTEHCASLGTEGDLVLANFNEYIIVEAPSDIQSSICVKFVEAEVAFRALTWVDGQPAWDASMTLANGDSVSPFVVLTT